MLDQLPAPGRITTAIWSISRTVIAHGQLPEMLETRLSSPRAWGTRCDLILL